MKFYVRENNHITEGRVFMECDMSIMFHYSTGLECVADYTISLGGNPRFLIDLVTDTGEYVGIRWFMEMERVIVKEILFQSNKKGKLYFLSKDDLEKYSGEMYDVLEDDCYYDRKRNLLCVGNPDARGEIIEFLPDVYAIISDFCLRAIILRVEDMDKKCIVKNGHICRAEE